MLLSHRTVYFILHHRILLGHRLLMFGAGLAPSLRHCLKRCLPGPDIFLKVLTLLTHLHYSFWVLAAHGHAGHSPFELVAGSNSVGATSPSLVHILHFI